MQNESRVKKKKLISTLIILVLIPTTILFGKIALGDRRYYFISLLVIIYTMVPFFMLFEKRKPKAREIILISSLSAIGVAGRMIFFMTPHFKPVMAIVIITGVALGREAGFLTGAITAFVSNFFFGQGPWTPWQMFSFGLVGFLSGVIFSKEIIKPKRIILCIFGGLSTFFIYGFIMNTSSVFMMNSHISFATLTAFILSGVPVDAIHALSTVIFLYLISEPMIEKLSRIKVKHGLLDNIESRVIS